MGQWARGTVVEITDAEEKKRNKNEKKWGQFKRPLGPH